MPHLKQCAAILFTKIAVSSHAYQGGIEYRLMAIAQNTGVAATPESIAAENRERSFAMRFAIWLFEELRFMGRVIVSSSDRFYRDNGFSRAASLAYTTLFALVPLTVLAFALLSPFALEHVPQVRQFIFQQFVPKLDDVNKTVDYLSQFGIALQSLNMLAIAFVVLTTILLLNSIEYALNAVWQVYEPRTIAHRIGIFCTIIVVAPVLALSAYYFTSYRLQALFQDIGMEGYLDVAYAMLVPYIIDFVAFLFLYFYVPKAPVRFSSAVFGGFLASILFSCAKIGFAHYIEMFSSYSKVYGALASVPIFLFWLYLAWSIVLFGAEVSYQAQYLPRRGKLFQRTAMSIGDGRLVLAVQALVLITRAFRSGEKLPSDIGLAEQLGCSTVLLKPAIDALEKAGIIQRGDSRSMPLTLMRSPETVTLEEVRLALFNVPVRIHFPEALARMCQAFHDNRPLESVTLAQLVGEENGGDK